MSAQQTPDSTPWPARVKAQRAALVAQICESLTQEGAGRQAAIQLSEATDALLAELFDAELAPFRGQIAILAVGGYGRSQLAPQSDLDLLVLVPDGAAPAREQAVTQMFYQLWDAGFKVGQAVRTIGQCVELGSTDLDTKTAMLQSRLLWGDKGLFERFEARVWRGLFAGRSPAFAAAKLAESDHRRAQPANSRLALEPNLKEGNGGLRDVHMLFWIAHVAFADPDPRALVQRELLKPEQLDRLLELEDFLLSVRFHLHRLAGRPEERLTFDLQTEIAPLMGYEYEAMQVRPHQAIEAFMRQYYLNTWEVKIMAEIAMASLKEEHAKGGWTALIGNLLPDGKDGEFRIRSGQLMFAQVQDFLDDPVAVLRLFLRSVETGRQVHPKTLQMITQNHHALPKGLADDPGTAAKVNALLLEILLHPNNPVATLRLMSDTWVLSKALPEWTPIAGMMQFNRYHHYTVDAHTLRALEWMHVLIFGQPEVRVGTLNADQVYAEHQLGSADALTKGQLDDLGGRELAGDLAKNFSNRRVLLVAMLLHDLMKGRDGDHSVLGAQMALTTCPRLGLTSEETEFVSWLVAQHLVMSDTAFKRDLEDSQTIEGFADRVETMERLQALFVLTVCDISAVGPDTWTSWKASLLGQLYRTTAQRLASGQKLVGAMQRAKQRREELFEALAKADPDKWGEEVPRLRVLRRMSNDYLAHVPLDLQIDHAALIAQDVADDEVAFSVLQDDVDRWTELSVYAVDHHGLFAGIAGAISLTGYTIESARAYTLRNGRALDTFAIRTKDGSAVKDKAALKRLQKRIREILTGDTSLAKRLEKEAKPKAKRLRVLDRAPTLRIDNDASERFTILELEGANAQGELYRVANELTRMNLVIHGAKISSYGDRYVDVFYLADITSGKVTSQAKIDQLKTRILELMQPPMIDKAAGAGGKSGAKTTVKNGAKNGTKTVTNGEAKSAPAADKTLEENQSA